MNRQEKLGILANEEGFDSVDAMIESASTDGVVPGICVNDGCDFTTEVEDDTRDGHCEYCETKTVQSCLILAEVTE